MHEARIKGWQVTSPPAAGLANSQHDRLGHRRKPQPSLGVFSRTAVLVPREKHYTASLTFRQALFIE
jgi:hypothetical protein